MPLILKDDGPRVLQLTPDECKFIWDIFIKDHWINRDRYDEVKPIIDAVYKMTQPEAEDAEQVQE